MKALIIGGGVAAEIHCKVLTGLNVKIEAVFDIKPDSAKELAEKFGAVAYDDLDAALKTDIDFVVICTPNGTHPKLLIQVMKAGKNVVDEKPFGLTVKECDEVLDVLKETKVICAPISQLRFSPVFCNIDENLSMDVDDIERCISPRTKAIMAVHYSSYPCNMDRIMEIAKKHKLLVIEDVSHAQGGRYKGKRLGTFGDIAAMSMMSSKSFAVGECGMLITDNIKYYQRAMAYGHYERNNENFIQDNEELEPFFGLPLGGVKARLNQVSAAIGRVQLKYYDERIEEIDKAMNYLWDLIEEIPGIRAIRPEKGSGSTNAGWYANMVIYDPAAFHGLSAKKFCEAVRAEMGDNGHTYAGGNFCLRTQSF